MKLTELSIERYLVDRLTAIGGETRKAKWLGRNGAPDRFVMHPNIPGGVWVECKSPSAVDSFPADARERAQQREHERMRALGCSVVLIGSRDGVELFTNWIERNEKRTGVL